jgi:hypothetical protein
MMKCHPVYQMKFSAVGAKRQTGAPSKYSRFVCGGEKVQNLPINDFSRAKIDACSGVKEREIAGRRIIVGRFCEA